MKAKAIKILKSAGLLLAGVLLTILVLRSYRAYTGDPLQLWHSYAPEELSGRKLANLN